MEDNVSQAIISTLLARCQALQLATIHGDKPRLCSLHFAVDNEMNFYWLSRRIRLHSVDLIENPDCAIGMIINTEVNQCLHFEGKARLLEGDETEKAIKCYEAKFGILAEAMRDEIVSGDSEKHGIYVFIPTSVTVYDELNFAASPKQVIDLEGLAAK